jgi:hypothetical protein
MVGRKKGHPKTGGRSKGVQNKTTQEAKELLNDVLSGEVDNIKDSLKRVRGDSDAKYLDALSKLFPYVFPKKSDITTDDKPLQANLNVTVDNSETAETLKRLRDEPRAKTDKRI